MDRSRCSIIIIGLPRYQALADNNVNKDGSTKDGASAFKAGFEGRSFNTPLEVKEFSQGAVKEVLRKILVRWVVTSTFRR